MIQSLWAHLQSALEQLQAVLGLERNLGDVNSGQMALRAILMYASALFLVRIGSKRFLSQATPFDIIVAVMLGSILSRAINGSAPFVATVIAGGALVGLHWLLYIVLWRACEGRASPPDQGWAGAARANAGCEAFLT